MDPPEMERRLEEALAACPPKVRSLILDVLTICDNAERARRIGELHSDERSRSFAEFLIDCEEDPAARTAVVGTLRETYGG